MNKVDEDEIHRLSEDPKIIKAACEDTKLSLICSACDKYDIEKGISDNIWCRYCCPNVGFKSISPFNGTITKAKSDRLSLIKKLKRVSDEESNLKRIIIEIERKNKNLLINKLYQ